MQLEQTMHQSIDGLDACEFASYKHGVVKVVLLDKVSAHLGQAHCCSMIATADKRRMID